MSIITRRGDDGSTDVMYGGRMPKTAPQVIACGAVDTLNASLGMVRIERPEQPIEVAIDAIQEKLIALMGLLSAPANRREKYLSRGYPSIKEEDTVWLESLIAPIPVTFEGWSRPGASHSRLAASLEMARTLCRQAEIASWAMQEDAHLPSCRFLNRLSDVLWIWARHVEKKVR